MPSIHDNTFIAGLRGAAAAIVLFAAAWPAWAGAPSENAGIGLLEAVEQTLANNKDVLISTQQVVQSEAGVTMASGEFDWVLAMDGSYEKEVAPLEERDRLDAQKAVDLGLLDAVEEPEETTVTYSAGVSRKFRSGVIVTPSLSATESEDNGENQDPKNYSRLQLEVTVPLLRGLGVKNAAADELAGESALTAARHMARHEISSLVLETVSQFWDALVAQQSFQLSENAHDRARGIFDRVERLVEVGELEPAFMDQALAKLYSSDRDMQNGRLSLRVSRQNLASALGLSRDALLNPPGPQGMFPEVMESLPDGGDAVSGLIKAAKNTRGDYLAALACVEKEEILAVQAKNNTRPRLDFTSALAYNGLDETQSPTRYHRTFSKNLEGPSFCAGFTLELPIENRIAKGNLALQRSYVAEARLNADKAEDAIASQVIVAYETLKNSVEEHRLAKLSEESYQRAVEFETRKYQSGESALNNVIDLEDRYLEARLARLDALRNYAAALAELKWATGGLISEAGGKWVFKPESVLRY